MKWLKVCCDARKVFIFFKENEEISIDSLGMMFFFMLTREFIYTEYIQNVNRMKHKIND